ncbi:hypothetical protein [Hymenobacter gummosus]|uniref:hypothetical protein n=1 Tax=Hymenobacter gummosus TaxID=1776032 RepID=UPI001FB39DAC|nr:hypothetical protein [Hymenobacter gummosus]
MKKILFLFSAVLLLGLAACEKVDKLLTFYVEDSQNIRISSNFPLALPPSWPPLR